MVGKKIKTANFTEPENRLLVKLLLENYNEYYGHGHLQCATRAEIGAVRDRLHQDWSEKINALGLSMRTAQQISEKVRKIVGKARSFISTEKRTQLGLPVEGPPVPLQPYMDPVVMKLRSEDDVNVFDPFRDYHSRSVEYPSSRDEVVVKEEYPSHTDHLNAQDMLEDNASYSNGDVPTEHEPSTSGTCHCVTRKRSSLPYLRKRFLMKKIEIAEVRLRKEKKLLELAEIQLEKEKELRGYVAR
ncbi:hypothetical protein COOONC_04279 [Cooperia oncophora]